MPEISNLLEEFGDLTGNPIILCLGDPYDDMMSIYCSEIDDGGGSTYWTSVKFLEGAWCTDEEQIDHGVTKHWIVLAIGPKNDVKHRTFYAPNSKNIILSQMQYSKVFEYRSDFEYAKLKARQVRFEHGQAPIIKSAKFN